MFHLTAAERKTLLVAGAAGGMAATFGTPVAAVLLAVELLLFEWKPRSLDPGGAGQRRRRRCCGRFLLRTAGAALSQSRRTSILAVPALLSSGGGRPAAPASVALVLTLAVYAMEDLFHRLPIHWMWWPALGGLVVGIGGYFQPRALGVGYDVIDDLLHGQSACWPMLVPLLVVKCCHLGHALGSGTSGGVLAPLLIMGGGARAPRGALPARRRRAAVAAGRAWPPSWAAPCARR